MIFGTFLGHYFQEKSQENIKDNKESRLKSVDIQGFTEFAKNRNKSGGFFKSRHSDHNKEKPFKLKGLNGFFFVLLIRLIFDEKYKNQECCKNSKNQNESLGFNGGNI